MTTRKKGYKIIVMVFVLLAYTMLVAFKSQETNDDKMCVSKIFGGLNCPLLLYIDVVRNIIRIIRP